MAALAATVCALALAACTGDESRDAASDEPLKVGLGEGFTWNDFTVEEGWTITSITRNAGMEQVTSPEISGSVVNDASEARYALFEIVLVQDGKPRATVKCSSEELVEDQSGDLDCPGLGATMPEDYDSIVVQPISHDDGSSA